MSVLTEIALDVVVQFLQDDADPVQGELGLVVAGFHPV